MPEHCSLQAHTVWKTRLWKKSSWCHISDQAKTVTGFAFQDYRKMHRSLLQLETKRWPNPSLSPASQNHHRFQGRRQDQRLCPIAHHLKFQPQRSQHLCKGPESRWKMWVAAKGIQPSLHRVKMAKGAGCWTVFRKPCYLKRTQFLVNRHWNGFVYCSL